MKRPLITLLTDFGARDHYVAAMKGVILGICPQANIIDISHEIPPFRIATGAYILAQAAATFPPGTIHVAVVDPGVGSSRRAIAARRGGHTYIGPDNGLLAMALDGPGKPSVFDITNQKLFRHPMSNTFHGRDIFAPVGAHLAKGAALSSTGRRLTNWNEGEFLRPLQAGPDEWTGSILNIDHFGNIVTNFRWSDFASVSSRPFFLRAGSNEINVFSNVYHEVSGGRLFVIRGSSDFLEISENKGNAAKAMKIDETSKITLALL